MVGYGNSKMSYIALSNSYISNQVFPHILIIKSLNPVVNHPELNSIAKAQIYKFLLYLYVIYSTAKFPPPDTRISPNWHPLIRIMSIHASAASTIRCTSRRIQLIASIIHKIMRRYTLCVLIPSQGIRYIYIPTSAYASREKRASR